MGKLDGKVAIITGTGAGIGKQMAILFAKEGAKIAMCDFREESLRKSEAELKALGAEVVAVVADVTKLGDLDNFYKRTIEQFGTVDILVNNAQGSLPAGSKPQLPFAETPSEYFDAYYRGSVLSTVHLMQLCYPHMRGKESSIINFSSSSSLGMKNSAVGLSAYATAKAAVAGLTRVAADEWGADGIRVNVIYPSVMTDSLEAHAARLEGVIPRMKENALRRLGYADKDCAPVCLFLAGEDSRFITGQAIHVEGGAYMAVA